MAALDALEPGGIEADGPRAVALAPDEDTDLDSPAEESPAGSAASPGRAPLCAADALADSAGLSAPIGAGSGASGASPGGARSGLPDPGARVPRRLPPRVARAIYVVLDLLVIPPLLLALHLLARGLGRQGLERLASRLGRLIARLFRCRSARRTLRVLRQAGVAMGATRDVLADACTHQLLTIFEIVALLDLEQVPVEDMVDVHGREHLDAALGQGRGVILVAGHMANWELACAALARLGYPLSILYFQQLSWLFDRYLCSLRRRHGVGLLHQRRGLKSAIKTLTDNRILGIMMDQDGTRHGIFTQFFGVDVSVPRGAPILALRHGAAIVPIHAVRQPGGRLQVVVEPALCVPRTASEAQDALALARLILEGIERSVSRAPSQWLIFYDRFMLRHSTKLAELGLLDHALAREALLGDGEP